MRWDGFSWRLVGELVLAVFAAGVAAQAPSAALKQADADYRAGVTALERGDLKTALADFQNVVKLAP